MSWACHVPTFRRGATAVVATFLLTVSGCAADGSEADSATQHPATPSPSSGADTTGAAAGTSPTAANRTDSAPEQSGSAREQGDTTGRADLPRLTGLDAQTGDTQERVMLRLEPGSERPQIRVEESDDATVTRPGSGRPVELAGDRALTVTLDPATASDDVAALRPDGSRVAEVRVLGSFEGQATVAIGTHGAGNLKPSIDTSDDRISIALRHRADPGTPPTTRTCGDVGFAPETDHGAFGIQARGVDCQQARDVASWAEGRVGEPYGHSSGFSCLAERDDEGPTTAFAYTCRRGSARITFTAS